MNEGLVRCQGRDGRNGQHKVQQIYYRLVLHLSFLESLESGALCFHAHPEYPAVLQLLLLLFVSLRLPLHCENLGESALEK